MTESSAIPQADDLLPDMSTRYLLMGYGESDVPAMSFACGRGGLRAALQELMFCPSLKPSQSDVEQIDGLMEDVDDPDMWQLNGYRLTFEFEIGGIEITKLAGQALPTTGGPSSQVADEVLDERWRQVSAEGWSDAHDDEHDSGDLAAAASAYAMNAADQLSPYSQGDMRNEQPMIWPWSSEWWKPKSPRRDLVRAAALIIAEIERIDRAETKGKAS